MTIQVFHDNNNIINTFSGAIFKTSVINNNTPLLIQHGIWGFLLSHDFMHLKMGTMGIYLKKYTMKIFYTYLACQSCLQDCVQAELVDLKRDMKHCTALVDHRHF